MRLEMNDDNKNVPGEGLKEPQKDDRPDSVQEEIKQQRAKFKDLDRKGKLQYIWDYYKWWFIVGVIAVIFGFHLVSDYMDNLKPTYLDAVMLNTYFAYDNTNTVKSDFINEYGIDTEAEHLYIDMDINLSEESFDTMMIASQQKLVSEYQAKELDVVIGPVETMEGSANCDCYGDLSQMLPQELIDELKDREYEFYYFDPSADEIEDYGEVREPYFAGIYLDNCSYLNNNGEYGAYPVAESEKDRVIFTIPANTQRLDHAIEFLEFLIKNR